MKSIMGKKLGMTQVFQEDGRLVPVTVIEAGPMLVTQVKTKETDGYEAVQFGYGTVKEHRVNKPLKGHFKKAGIGAKKHLREFKVSDISAYKLSDEVSVDIFEPGDFIDATATSKGKGFQGPIKRHGFSRGRETHGSHYHRGPGALAMASTPSRVFKGRKLAGHMGSERVTIKNLEVVQVDKENNLLLIKGSVPGPKRGLVLIKESNR